MATSESIKPRRTTEEILQAGRQKAAEAIEKINRGKDVEIESKLVAQSQLPLWPELIRAIPNPVLRSALFGVANERKTYSKRTLVASVEGIEVRVLGTMFNQSDLDVVIQLWHMARLQALGTEIRFSARSLLKDLGRGQGGKDHEQLKEEIARLAGGLVEITLTRGGKTYFGSLIGDGYRDEEAELYVINFNPKFGKLFEAGYASIEWEQRKQLGRNNLAKWLHLWCKSHDKIFPYKVATFKRLCGSTTPLRNFRIMLKTALNKLKSLSVIVDWSLDESTDVITITRTQTHQHLTRRAS
jgi:hypothetical protein